MSQGCEKTRLRGSERTIGREVDLSPIFVTLSVSPAITGTESTGTAAWGAAACDPTSCRAEAQGCLAALFNLDGPAKAGDVVLATSLTTAMLDPTSTPGTQGFHRLLMSVGRSWMTGNGGDIQAKESGW